MKTNPSEFVPFQTKLTAHDRKRIKVAMQQTENGKGKPMNDIKAWK